MANYLYNGVEFPEIPSDILADNPYAIILYEPENPVVYLCLAGASWIYNINYSMIDVGTGYYRQQYELTNGEWVFVKQFGTQVNPDDLFWSSHDIMTNTESRDYTSSELYFEGTEPVIVNENEINPLDLTPYIGVGGAMLYNGQEFPSLPEDMSSRLDTHPYVYMFAIDASLRYRIWMLTDPITYDSTVNDYLLASTSTGLHEYTFTAGTSSSWADNTWDLPEDTGWTGDATGYEALSGYAGGSVTPLWSNIDISDENGNVVLTASYPVSTFCHKSFQLGLTIGMGLAGDLSQYQHVYLALQVGLDVIDNSGLKFTDPLYSSFIMHFVTEQIFATEELVDERTGAPVLCLFDPINNIAATSSITLVPDSSGEGVSAVIFHGDDMCYCIIVYDTSVNFGTEDNPIYAPSTGIYIGTGMVFAAALGYFPAITFYLPVKE